MSGGGAIGLDVGARNYNSVRSILGVALDLSPPEADDPQGYDLTLRVGWAHDYADDAGDVTASFAGAPGQASPSKAPHWPRQSGARIL